MSGQKKLDYFSEVITGGDIFLHAAEDILCLEKTRYQQLALIKSPLLGRVLLLDNICQISEADEFIYHELLVHLPCLYHANPQKVLILGGGDGCALREALRWQSVKEVVLVDIDKQVIKCAKSYLSDLNQNSLEHPKAKIIIQDAFKFIKENQTLWDVIICDLSDPIEKGPSLALFTVEFFSQLKQILSSEGIISVQSGPAAPPDHYCFTRVAHTLKQVFPYFKACLCFCQSYLTPLGFSLVSLKEFKAFSAKQIDTLINEQIKGELKFLDSETFFSSTILPKYLKQALKEEKTVYSLKNQPNWFSTNPT